LSIWPCSKALCSSQLIRLFTKFAILFLCIIAGIEHQNISMEVHNMYNKLLISRNLFVMSLLIGAWAAYTILC
jgi:hypothetical protein